jgi:hypothetical protein
MLLNIIIHFAAANFRAKQEEKSNSVRFRLIIKLVVVE